jgi:hypothetical protein
MSESYEDIRRHYLPAHVKALIITESPPPAANKPSSRHFYRSDHARKDDRLFVNTMKALYPEAATMTEGTLEPEKEKWLRRFQADGWYMIEALPNSLPHHITKPQRQAFIQQHLQQLIERVKQVANPNTKLILIKSNVFEVAAEPLRRAGLAVLNTELVDYPGQFNQRAYREKISHLARKI